MFCGDFLFKPLSCYYFSDLSCKCIASKYDINPFVCKFTLACCTGGHYSLKERLE